MGSKHNIWESMTRFIDFQNEALEDVKGKDLEEILEIIYDKSEELINTIDEILDDDSELSDEFKKAASGKMDLFKELKTHIESIEKIVEKIEDKQEELED